jgi:hypothetical protein
MKNIISEEIKLILRQLLESNFLRIVPMQLWGNLFYLSAAPIFIGKIKSLDQKTVFGVLHLD